MFAQGPRHALRRLWVYMLFGRRERDKRYSSHTQISTYCHTIAYWTWKLRETNCDTTIALETKTSITLKNSYKMLKMLKISFWYTQHHIFSPISLYCSVFFITDIALIYTAFRWFHFNWKLTIFNSVTS